MVDNHGILLLGGNLKIECIIYICKGLPLTEKRNWFGMIFFFFSNWCLFTDSSSGRLGYVYSVTLKKKCPLYSFINSLMQF